MRLFYARVSLFVKIELRPLLWSELGQSLQGLNGLINGYNGGMPRLMGGEVAPRLGLVV